MSLVEDLLGTGGCEEGVWPDHAISILSHNDVWKWAIPKSCGGLGVSFAQLLWFYHDLAKFDLSLCVLMINRDAVFPILDRCKQNWVSELLTRQTRPGSFVTNSINFMRKGQKKKRVLAQLGTSVVLAGKLPWVSGAKKSEGIVAGAYLQDGQEILVWLPTNSEGLEIEEPEPFVALDATMTSSVLCHDVSVPKANLVVGPTAEVFDPNSPKPAMVGAVMALGTASGMLRRLEEEHGAQTLIPFLQWREKLSELKEETNILIEKEPTIAEAQVLRAKVGDSLYRLAIAGFVDTRGRAWIRHSHSFRYLREALFFGVFGSPDNVIKETMKHFSP